jgi:hypothetical protein
MTYDVIVLACEQLSNRDKLRLAQLLIQTARKEEENTNPQNRSEPKIVEKAKAKAKEEPLNETDTMEYVVERLFKSKPKDKKSLTNFIKAMFQFQGGIAESDIEKIISALKKRRYIKIEANKIVYL